MTEKRYFLIGYLYTQGEIGHTSTQGQMLSAIMSIFPTYSDLVNLFITHASSEWVWTDTIKVISFEEIQEHEYLIFTQNMPTIDLTT